MIKNSTLWAIAFLLLGININAQTGSVGINTNTPQSALDIKSHNNNSDKVLRVSTSPSDINKNEEFVFFMGQAVKNGNTTTGYDLRKMTLNELANQMATIFPSLNKIIVDNSLPETFAQRNINTPVTLNELVANTNHDIFGFNKTNKSVVIKEAGIYNISATVGFRELSAYEGDIIISVALKGPNESNFTNFKRNVISRSANSSVYNVGKGVGSSFSFVEEFGAGDEVRIHVNTTNTTSVRLLDGGANLVVAKETTRKGDISIR